MRQGLRVTAWVGTGTCALLLLAQPVSVQAQFTFNITIIFAMLAVWAVGHGRAARQLFLALGSFVVIRYMYWRLTSTLPSPSDPIGFALGVVLLGAELYCVLILVISLIINADPLERPPVPQDEDEDLPHVDVFVPSYNEDETILATTLAAALSMDYPADKLTVWLLDDGGTEQKCHDADPRKAAAARERRATLQALCDDLGARYLTRARNEHAKAGNLNNGLQYSTGEIVVVFDADHAPFRRFLRETVGHFARDRRLFLVQTPHVFLNPDPIERNLRTWTMMPSENEMFYSVTQCGLDKWNGSFFCGSAALLRRTALDVAGGFAGITITEDCETALELHSRGWTSVYVDRPLIAGLQPETFGSFIGQRSRWLQGMFQILLLKNPGLKRGLRPIQRLAYLSSMAFWAFPLPRLVFMFAPLSHIFFDVKIFVSNVNEALAYTTAYVVVNLMLQNYLYGRVRWPWMAEIYEYVQGVYLAKALVSVIARPHKPTFNVTSKGLTLDNDHLSELAWPYFAIWGLLLGGSLMAAWRYAFEPGVSNLMLVVGLWNTLNLLVAGAGLGTVAERAQRERHPSLPIDRRGTLSNGARHHAVRIVSVSGGGCKVLPAEGLFLPHFEPGTLLDLSIEPVGTQVTMETLPLVTGALEPGGGGLVCSFSSLAPADYFVLADLMYGDSDAMRRFLLSRRKHKSIFSGSLQLLIWGVTEPVRAFRYLFAGARSMKPAGGEAEWLAGTSPKPATVKAA